MMRALTPLAAAVLSVLLASISGLSERSLALTPLEGLLYGYFARLYPLFGFAVVYGAAGIILAAAEPGPRRLVRWLLALAALALFLAACLYPTFGGFVLRAGFMTGTMSFMRGQSAWLSAALGAGAAALVFAAALGIARGLVRLRIGPRPVSGAVLSFAALWLGAGIALALTGLRPDALVPWPDGPMPPGSSWIAAGIVGLALAPHALSRILLCSWGGRPTPPG